MVGITGVNEIHNTTIAKFMYERISGQFEASCFLKDVGEKTRKHGLASLEREFLSQVQEVQEDGMVYVTKENFKNKRVLLVLDDVDGKDQLSLAEELNWFGQGSRVIITTRDASLLQQNVTAIYEVGFLDEILAAQSLFGSSESLWDKLKLLAKSFESEDDVKSQTYSACSSSRPCSSESKYDERTGDVLDGKSKIIECSPIPVCRPCSFESKYDIRTEAVFSNLFDSDKDMQVFLDIAYIFDGDDKDNVIKNLNACGFDAKHSIEVLEDKSLLIVIDNKVSMHQAHKDFGMDFVQKQSQKPHGRSRLRTAKDILNALSVQEETKEVEAMSLDISELRQQERLSRVSFKGMDKLRLIKFFHPRPSPEYSNRVLLPAGLIHYLPEKLRYLRWDFFPSERLPSNFAPKNLVELRMPFSKVKELWTGKQHMPNLRIIDFSHSNLTRIPDLSEAEAIERIYLSNCENLIDASSIQNLKKLKHLDLKSCTNLQGLPNTEGCVSLTTLMLSGCSNLTELSKLSSFIEYLYLEGLPIEELHPSVKDLSNLVELDVRNCERLWQIHVDLYELTSLKKLGLAGSRKLLRHLGDDIPERPDLEVDDGKRSCMDYIWDMVSVEWILLYSGLLIEIASSTFEQRHYPLMGMIMAILGLLLLALELTLKARKQQAIWEWGGFLPWIYSRHPHHKLFGTVMEYFALVAALWQVFHSTVGYVYSLQKLPYPIKMNLIMFLFVLCQFVGKLIEKRSSTRSPYQHYC